MMVLGIYQRVSAAIVVVTTVGLSIPAAAGAQINRSQPPASQPSGGQGGHPSPAPSSAGPTRSDGGHSSSASAPGSSSRGDRSGTSGMTGHGSAAGSFQRGGITSLDRYNRTHESSAAKGSLTSSHGNPGLIYPFGYFPGGYFPGAYDPYGYPGYPRVPYPGSDPSYPYPGPRDRSILSSRYDSPYYFCDDLTGSRYVNGATVIIARPKRLYTPTPLYKGGELDGWRDLGADDYMAERNVEGADYRVREQLTADAALGAVITDITRSWTKGDVEPLARHVRKESPIAIVLRGKYQYSLEAGDLLAITRAAYNSPTPLRFVADHIHKRAAGVYALTGRHIYTDNSAIERTIYFTYVLARTKDDYTVTQMATAAAND